MRFGLVMAALVGMAVSTFANNADASIRVDEGKGKTIRFTINNSPVVRLALVSSESELLFEESASALPSASRAYDLTSFPDGKYILVAETPSKVSYFDVILKGDSAKISDAPAREIQKPVVFNKKKRVSVSLINPANSPVSFSIYNSDNQELYSETTADKVSLVKMFDFEKAGNGEYTIVTSFGGQSFTDKVVIRN